MPPVKAILATFGWVVKTLPQGSGKPVIILITPGGNPLLSTNSANLNSAAGACSEAFTTTVLPAAKAGAILVAARKS